MLIGWSCRGLCGSTPQPHPADSSIRGDDETDMTDRTAQSHNRLTVVMSVVRTKLQRTEEDTSEEAVYLSK